MKTTMKMIDLKYKDGFPKHIDKTKMVVVTVRNKKNSLISYYDKVYHEVDFDWISNLDKKYKEGIYVIKPK